MSRRWRDDEGGAVLVLTGFVLVVLLAVSAVAVDLGRLAVTSRDQQGATDRAALDAVLALRDDLDPYTAADTAAGAALARNPGVSGRGMSSPRGLGGVELGTFDAATGVFTAFPPGAPYPDAVRVVTTSSVDALFAPGATEVVREAIAQQEAVASIAAATTTTALDTADSAVLNGLVGGLLGGDVALDVASWQGIADTGVGLGALAAELGVGTAEELLASSVSVGELATLLAGAVQRDGGTAAVGLGALAAAVPATPPLALGEVLAIAGGDPALGADVGALDLLLAAAQVANGGSAIDLGAGVPGIAATELTIVSPPVLAVGRARLEADGVTWRTRARTAQTAVRARVPVTGSLGLDLGPLVRTRVLGDLTVEVATGAADLALTAARCAAPGRVDVAATTGAVQLRIPETDVARLELLSILGRPLLSVDVSIRSAATIGGASETLTFTGPFPAAPRTLATSSPGLAALTAPGNLEVTASASLAGLGLDLGRLTSGVVGLVTPLLAGLDDALEPLLASLGVSLGEVDVRAQGLDCSGRVLVR